MKTAKTTNYKIKELLQVFTLLENTKEVDIFLQDLLTKTELEEFANRWQVAKMLESKTPYTKIESQTGMSSTTIARISKWLQGGAGGYKMMLEKIKNLDRHPDAN